MAIEASKQISGSPFDMNTLTTDQPSPDYFTAMINAPVSKLDADQYSAEDIDGVTEGLFGSGNLNYLMMQANQTNESMAVADPFESPFSESNPSPFSLMIGGNGAGVSGVSPLSSEFSASDMRITDTDRPVDNAQPVTSESAISDGAFSNTTLGSLGASNFSANAISLQPSSGSDGVSGLSSDGSDGVSGINGLDGIRGIDGTPGANGTDGTDGGGGGDTFIDIDLGDLIIDLGDFTLIDLGDVTTLITTTITNITDIINNILGGGEWHGITLDLDVLLSDITDLTLGLSILDGVTHTLQQIVDLNPVVDLLGDNLDLADILTGTLGTHITLLGGDDYLEAGDYDLLLNTDFQLAGLSLPPINLDIPLDPLEGLLGDIDIDVGGTLDGLAGNLLDGDLLDGVVGGVLDGSTVSDLVDGVLNGGTVDDIVDGLTEGTIVGGLTDALLGDGGVGGIIDGIPGGNALGDVVGTLLGGDGAGDILGGLGDAVGGLLGGDSGGLLDGIGLGGSGDDTDLGLGLAGGGLPGDMLDIIIDPVEDLAGDLDILGDLGLDILGLGGHETDNGAGDTDITLGLGIDTLDDTLLGGGLDVPLDPVEDLIGDVDLDLGAAADVLGSAADGLIDNLAGGTGDDTPLAGFGNTLGDIAGDLIPSLGDGDSADNDLSLDGALGAFGENPVVPDLDVVLDPVEQLLGGDIDVAGNAGLDLLGDSETDNNAGDTDIDIDLDIDALNIDLVDTDLDIPLDPVEDILGDIDLNVGDAISLLDSQPAAGGLGDILGGGDDGGILAWPENILPDAGDILGGGGGDGGLGALLPDPLGSVVEGLGILPFAQDNQGGHGGGLLGGGLFG